MCALSNHIRERPSWWEEVKYQVIIDNWRAEILRREEASNEAPSRRLTPAMVKSCYLQTAPPVPTLIPRSTTYSRNSMGTHLCVIK